MSKIIICPKCNSIANWSYYFQKYICEECFSEVIDEEKCDYCFDFDPKGSYEVELYWNNHKAESCEAKYCPSCGKELPVIK